MPRNEIVYGKGFLADVRRLPVEAQRKLADLLVILSDNPFDPRLHTKPLAAPLHGKFSFRIMRDWRVGFEFLTQTDIRLLVADHRSTVYRRLLRKS